MIAPLVAAVLAAADPCVEVDVGATPDPIGAKAYREVAAEELARGRTDAALAAYRAAVARDPSDDASRAALRRLCESSARAEDPLARGLRLMDAGDYRGAMLAFREVREAMPSPSTALLQGICHYELGEDAQATELLHEAEEYPPHRDEARFYLGLVALRAGAGREAASLFESARGSAALERAASDLARLASQQGRLAVSLLAESGWDSNVNLAPTGVPSTAPESDGVWALTGSLLVRPNGWSGPYLRASGLLHQPMTLGAFAVRGFDAAAGWQLRSRRAQLVAEYDYGSRTFGGAPYLASHRLLASAAVRTGLAFVGATYLARFESYAAGWAPFDGVLQRAEVRIGLPASRDVWIAIAYGLGREDASDAVLSYTEHGPRAEVRIAPRARWRLGLDASAFRRSYDEYDASLGSTRRDTYLDASAFAEVDVAPGWTARFSLVGRRATSSVPDLEYGKAVPSFGLSYLRGFR